MHLAGLWLTDFRCYREAEIRLMPGVTVISGANAQGKTSLLEAVAWAATGSSFRGVPDAALVRTGCDAAILRAEVVDGARVQMLEAEIRATGRNRVQVNRQALKRAQDRRRARAGHGVLARRPPAGEGRAGGPARLPRRPPGRRRAPLRRGARRLRARAAATQRPAAPRHSQRGRQEHAARCSTPSSPGRARRSPGGGCGCSSALTPLVADAYRELAGTEHRRRRRLRVGVVHRRSTTWSRRSSPPSGAPESRARARGHVDRAAPRRVAAARRRARQPFALVAGRAAHARARAAARPAIASSPKSLGTPPVLLLDDVFSELDNHRSAALLAHLDAGQTLVTTQARCRPVCTPSKCSGSTPVVWKPRDRATRDR